MLRTTRHIAATLFIFSMIVEVSVAQRIRFGLFASDNIILTPLGLAELNFNNKQTIILQGNQVTINLFDEACAVLTIEGRADLDVTVTIHASATIDLDALNKIPLNIRFAYSNLGALNESMAKSQAVEVPAGFTGATFPILRRASGPPGPPPTPAHTGYIQPTARAYLFIYGTLGPVPIGAASGIYTGDIMINVEYSTYN